MRDSQRSKVYRWEYRTVPNYWNQITFEECKTLVVKICRDLGQRPPAVMPATAKTRHPSGGPERVIFPPGCRTKAIVLHELAHTLTYRSFPGVAGHGPEYVRCLIWLLNKYHKMPVRTLYQAAQLWGVKCGPFSVVKTIKERGR